MCQQGQKSQVEVKFQGTAKSKLVSLSVQGVCLCVKSFREYNRSAFKEEAPGRKHVKILKQNGLPF